MSAKINWIEARQSEVKRYLNKFTDLEYEDAKREMINKGDYKFCMGNGTRTIFLVGPCIVAGWEAFPGDGLGEKLYKKLISSGLDYKIVNVYVTARPDSNIKKILEYDIKENDIVIFIDDNIEEADFNFDYIYNNYMGDKWLYSDRPIHTTNTGNELISDELINNIIQPIFKISEDVCDKNILHKGVKQLTYEESAVLEKYLKDLKKYHNTFSGTIGACLMTCNPFTKGHYHLIEYASKQVDFLYVFVLAEDAFSVPFKDRIEMVRRGVRKLENVIVLPCDTVWLSKETFKSYFEREINPDAVVDAHKETMIFRDYIAPALDISKRFIGEEPNDNLTNQYNQLLKRELSDVMDVIEIPRKKQNGENISASTVRRYLEKENWNEIEKIVPQSTLHYLKRNIKRFKKNENGPVDRIVEYIRKHRKVVICGLGSDADNLIKRLECLLEAEDFEKLEFYDRKATKMNYTYRGKKVISLEELVDEYKDYHIVIATTKYRKDIFYSLFKNNMNLDQITAI